MHKEMNESIACGLSAAAVAGNVLVKLLVKVNEQRNNKVEFEVSRY